MEFTVENLQLFVLETSRAKRKPRASVQIAVDMVQEKILTEREALLRIEPAQMEYFLFPTVMDEFCKYCVSSASIVFSAYMSIMFDALNLSTQQ